MQLVHLLKCDADDGNRKYNDDGGDNDNDDDDDYDYNTLCN